MGDASLDPELRYQVYMRAAAGEDTTFLAPIAQSITPLGSGVEIGCTIVHYHQLQNLVKASACCSFLFRLIRISLQLAINLSLVKSAAPEFEIAGLNFHTLLAILRLTDSICENLYRLRHLS